MLQKFIGFFYKIELVLSCKFRWLLVILLSGLLTAEVYSETEASDDGWTFEDSPLSEDEIDECYDPWEPFNRLMFYINGCIDKAFFVPIATLYKVVFPAFIQIGINNFVSNFFSPVRCILFLFQKDGTNLVKTLFRFAINTVFGFFGTADVAKTMGIKSNDTSLGDTFKKWGVKPGPYVVLPILGPTSLRGAVAKAFHFGLDPFAQISLYRHKKNTRNKYYYTIYGADLLSKRSKILSIMKDLDNLLDDEYILYRNVVMSTEK
ncbi:MAG: VacJ family lipoprotein [Holosporales bacterium]|jgi:phospholipid-binding lipoprotein MlaA|nr:VacJ family lipoprotein [Holosporales bacterium]